MTTTQVYHVYIRATAEEIWAAITRPELTVQYFHRVTIEITPETRTEDEWRLMRKWHAYGDDQIVALWRQANAFAADYDDMAFTPPRLATIAARTLVVHGDRDPYYPVDLAVEMYTAIPRAYLWVIPNGGHGPIFGDVDGFVRTALTFLGGAW